MEEIERDLLHELWLTKARHDRQEHRPRIFTDGRILFVIPRQMLMLLTLERHLMEFLRQIWNNLPAGTMRELNLTLYTTTYDTYCRDPPDDDALEATATELVQFINNTDSMKSLCLDRASASFALSVLAACPRLEILKLEACPLVAAELKAIFSIQSLRKLDIMRCDLQDSETVDAFCHGMETTKSLETLVMSWVSFRREHEERMASALARSKSLVAIEFTARVSDVFYRGYCVALSNNVHTKLERLQLDNGQERRWHTRLELYGDGRPGSRGLPNTTIVIKIRNLLRWNVQRKTCPPLFAAIDTAATDAVRKQCLVAACKAVDIPSL